MRDNVINLKVVLANGDIIKTGSRARKSSAGYDLTRPMIGSEGTLGIITEVTLRLQKIPQHSVVAMCNFPTIKDAADVAIATMLSGIQVSRVELMDEVQVRAINLANSKNLPKVPTLLFEFIGTEAYAREQTLVVQKIASGHNGSDFVFAEDPEGKKELWKLRKEALWACFAMVPNSEAMITDVCVPLSRLAELISRAKQELGSSSLVCTVVAHTGDGNFHAVILFDPDQEEQRKEAERLNQFIVHTALAMEVSRGRTGNREFEDNGKDKRCFRSQQHHESRKAHPTPCLSVRGLALYLLMLQPIFYSLFTNSRVTEDSPNITWHNLVVCV